MCQIRYFGVVIQLAVVNFKVDDPWINNKSLVDLMGWNNLNIFGGTDKKVSLIINNNDWKPENHEATHIFKTSISSLEIDNNIDKDSWSWNLAIKGKFSFKNSWNYIKVDEREVNWHKVVWNKSNCPKMAFCTHFALLNKLPTGERCSKWSKKDIPKCMLCKDKEEDVNHIFFNYAYSLKIWFIGKNKLKINPSVNIQNIRDSINYFILFFKGNKDEMKKASVVLTTVIYSLWKERNNRLHNNKETDCFQLWRQIEADCNIILFKAKTNSNFQGNIINTCDLDNYEDRAEAYLQGGKYPLDFSK